MSFHNRGGGWTETHLLFLPPESSFSTYVYVEKRDFVPAVIRLVFFFKGVFVRLTYFFKDLVCDRWKVPVGDVVPLPIYD